MDERARRERQDLSEVCKRVAKLKGVSPDDRRKLHRLARLLRVSQSNVARAVDGIPTEAELREVLVEIRDMAAGGTELDQDYGGDQEEENIERLWRCLQLAKGGLGER